MRFVQMPWDAWWGLMVLESMNESIGTEVSSSLEGDDCVLCALSCVVAVNDNVRMINVLHNTSVTSDLEFLSLKPAQNKKGRPLAVLASCYFVVCVLISCLLLSISPLIPGAHLPLSFRAYVLTYWGHRDKPKDVQLCAALPILRNLLFTSQGSPLSLSLGGK